LGAKVERGARGKGVFNIWPRSEYGVFRGRLYFIRVGPVAEAKVYQGWANRIH